MFQITIYHRILSVVLIATLLQSCSYYQFRSIDNSAKAQKREISKRPAYKNYYVVHVGDNAWQLENTVVTNDSITGNITSMNPKVKEYMQSAYNGGRQRVVREDLKYINQVHVYLKEFEATNNKAAIATGDIVKMDVMNMNVGLKFLTVTSIAILSAGGALAILLLIACNCPHTYVFDGNQYYLNNTLFTGATSPALERNDFKLMPDYTPDANAYNFFIRNDEEEHQFTNLLELIVVNHDNDTEISMDQEGKIYSIKDPIQPIAVMDNSGNDLTNIVAFNDDMGHRFDNASNDDYNSLFTTFEKPEKVVDAKLILKTKNNEWGGLVYNEFSKLFGKYYDNWVQKNHKKSKEEVMENLKKIGIPLVISVKKNGEWIDVEEINLIGDVNYNSLVVPINPELLTDDQIEIRVRSGFMFWDLDCINIDFTPDQELNVQRLSPTSATGNEGRNDTEALSNNDALYMQHLNPGDSTSIQFEGIETFDGQKRTIFLRSKGYYLPQKEFAGKLQRQELAKVNVDGGLSIYSRKLYTEFFLNYSLKLD